jgi:hypothetical protein
MNEATENIFSAIPVLLLILIVLAFVFIYVWSFIWLYKDAQLREKSGCLVILVLFFFVPWPWGLIIWLVCRPGIRYNYPEYHRRKPIANVINMKRCPACNRETSPYDSKCLYCGAELMKENN